MSQSQPQNVLVTVGAFSLPEQDAAKRFLVERGLTPIHVPGPVPKNRLLEIFDHHGQNGGIHGVLADLDPWDPEVLHAAARCGVKTICRSGVGYDRVDLPKAKELGITVTRTPGINHHAVAELTVTGMNAHLRNFADLLASMRVKKWPAPKPAGRDLRGKTIGMIGFGMIGRAVVQRLIGWEVQIRIYDAFWNATQHTALERFAGAASEFGCSIARFESLDDALAPCDLVSLHVDVNPQTRGMVNREFLEKHLVGKILVNYSRGELVDESAVVAALEDETLAGYVSDVFCVEPLPEEHALFTAKRTLLTPHVATWTHDTNGEQMLRAAQYIAIGLGQQVDGVPAPVWLWN